MANDDFFDALDAAEAEQGKKILESKNTKKVRYWYEEGYVPGNELDSDEEDNTNNKPEEAAEEVESDCDSSASSTKYEEVSLQAGAKHGGQRVRWGGIHGKLALTDASPTTLARFDEVMDELLLPGGDSGARGSDDQELSEVTSVVLAQTPQDGRCWSYSYNSCLAIEDVRLEEEYEATKARFAIEETTENAQVRSEAEPAMAQCVKAHDRMRKEARDEFIREFRKEEAKRRSIERGAREQLPGTRKPMALSQEWQARKAESSGRTPAAPKPSGRSLLPCSLSSSSSSMPRDSRNELRKEMRLAVGQSENMALRRAPMQQVLNESVLTPEPVPEPEDDGMQPQFRIPKKPVPKFRSKPL